MRLVLMLLALVIGPGLAAADIALEAKTVLDGKVTLLLPKDFQPMGEEMLKLKYPKDRRPTLVYTNDGGSVNIALNHTSDRVSAEQLKECGKVMEAAFRRLYPTAEWFRSELTSIGGREFFVLELRTPAVDTDVRNLMACTSLDGRMLLVSFNVTQELEPQWLTAGNNIIESIKVNSGP